MPAPDNYFDGTNIILTIVGDEPTERDISMTNNATTTRTEPLTDTQIPAGQTVLVRVKGDMAFDQILSNIAAINALQGFDVIGVTSIPVEDESEPVSPFTFTNAQFGDSQYMQYTGGTIAFDYINGVPAFAITTPLALNKYYGVRQPDYDVDGINAFAEVHLILSPNNDPRAAYSNRMQGPGAFASDSTAANGENSGFSINKAGQLNLLSVTGTRVSATAQVVNDAVNWNVHDADTGTGNEYIDAQPGIQNQSLYCHVIVLLNPEWTELDLEQIKIWLALHGMPQD